MLKWAARGCWLRDVGMVFQRRIAEPRIFFETLLGVLRALQLTLSREAAEAVGTLRGFPLRGGRRGLRGDIKRILSSKKISACSAEHKPWRLRRLCAFCVLTRQRQRTCISVYSHLQNLCAFASLRLRYTGKPEVSKKNCVFTVFVLIKL